MVVAGGVTRASLDRLRRHKLAEPVEEGKGRGRGRGERACPRRIKKFFMKLLFFSFFPSAAPSLSKNVIIAPIPEKQLSHRVRGSTVV